MAERLLDTVESDDEDTVESAQLTTKGAGDASNHDFCGANDRNLVWEPLQQKDIPSMEEISAADIFSLPIKY